MMFRLLSNLANNKEINKNTIFLIGIIRNDIIDDKFIIYHNNEFQITNKELKKLGIATVQQMFKYKNKIDFCNLNEYLNFLNKNNGVTI